MSAGSDPAPAAPSDPKVPKSPIPFTAQFGSEGPLTSAGESARLSSFAENFKSVQRTASSPASFASMFAPETSAQNQPAEPAAEITRVFDRSTRETGNTVAPPTARSSGFTELFGSPQTAAPGPESKSTPVSTFESKAPGFTELFKPQAPAAQAMPTAQQPLSPLSAQPGTGRFTELFKSQPTSASDPKPAAPTPFSGSGASGFTELFKNPATPSQPAATPPVSPTQAESGAGGFTQLFKGSVASPKPNPVSPKPAGELTRMISGSDLGAQPPSQGSPSVAPQGGATRLFTAGASAPAMAPLPAGPSEYTRIVSPRQLKDLQQAAPAANNSAATPSPIQMAPPAGVPAVPSPQFATPQPPTVAAPWQPPQVQPVSPYGLQPPQVPSAPAAFPPAPAAAAPKAESKLLTYLPLIIGLNVLFLIAVLLILLFALKR